jgi:AcrR family transcriptional regulator
VVKNEAPTPTKVRLPRAERQRQILAVAREVFIEFGLSDARSRDIAERAGITEGYLYRHFPTKEDLFAAAIEEGLEHLVTGLQEQIDELKATKGIRRDQLLERANLLFLEAMAEIAPLLTVAIFTDLPKGKVFYRDRIRPRLQQAVESIVADVSGWDPPRIDPDIVTTSFFGVHYGLCLDYLLRNQPLDAQVVARQITDMFSPGISVTDADSSAPLARSNGRSAKAGTRTTAKAAPKKSSARRG